MLRFYNSRFCISAAALVNFFLDNWPLFLLAAVSGGMLMWPAIQRNGGGGAVSPSEAVRLINREKAVLIDVCEDSEFKAGHAVGARNVPLGQLDGAKALPSNKALPVVVLCASGARAGRAAAQLRKAGFEKAVSVAGGNAAWREAQLPMEKSS
jgi:rhodanese-related sulfurtransferase